MPDLDLSKPTVAEPEEAAFRIAYALMFDGRKQFDRARNFIAELTAAYLVTCLSRSGFVVMRRPPALGTLRRTTCST